MCIQQIWHDDAALDREIPGTQPGFSIGQTTAQLSNHSQSQQIQQEKSRQFSLTNGVETESKTEKDSEIKQIK